MPAKRKPNDPPELLRVLVELQIEMQPQDTPEEWMAALEQDFLPQLPGAVTVLEPPPEPPRTVEEPGATDPQFPTWIDNPDMDAYLGKGAFTDNSKIRPAAIHLKLEERPSRVTVIFEMRGMPDIVLTMSPGAAAELGEQLLYARDKLTDRR